MGEERRRRREPPAGPSDEALALRCRQGDLDAFETLARRYQDRLFAYALRMLGSRQDAEDAVQEILLRLYRSMGRFDARQRFVGWAFGVAAHVCRDALRRKGRRREEPVGEFHQASSGPGPSEAASADERQALVAEAVMGLPPKYREVVVLHYLEGMGYEEAAATLGIRAEAARQRALRARVMLRRALEERGL